MLENVKKQKSAHKEFPRWLKLFLYKNCFGEGDSVHLGLKFRGIYYCITHSRGNGVEIPKKYLKMKDISKKTEYLKRCTELPIIMHPTNMSISEAFLVTAILELELK